MEGLSWSSLLTVSVGETTM